MSLIRFIFAIINLTKNLTLLEISIFTQSILGISIIQPKGNLPIFLEISLSCSGGDLSLEFHYPILETIYFWNSIFSS